MGVLTQGALLRSVDLDCSIGYHEAQPPPARSWCASSSDAEDDAGVAWAARASLSLCETPQRTATAMSVFPAMHRPAALIARAPRSAGAEGGPVLKLKAPVHLNTASQREGNMKTSVSASSHPPLRLRKILDISAARRPILDFEGR